MAHLLSFVFSRVFFLSYPSFYLRAWLKGFHWLLLLLVAFWFLFRKRGRASEAKTIMVVNDAGCNGRSCRRQEKTLVCVFMNEKLLLILNSRWPAHWSSAVLALLFVWLVVLARTKWKPRGKTSNLTETDRIFFYLFELLANAGDASQICFVGTSAVDPCISDSQKWK